MEKAMKEKESTTRLVQIKLIDPPNIIDRSEIDEDAITELAENIKQIGQLQAIVIRPVKDRYEIVAGHRRFLAHEMMGRSVINAVIKEMTDEEAAIARASENLARVDLSLIEEARIYKNLHDNHKLTYAQIGKKMGKTAGLVKRRLDLLIMPKILQKAIHKNLIGYGVAEELWRMKDETAIEYYLGFCVDHGATKEVAKQWAKEYLDNKRRKDSPMEEGSGLLNPIVETPIYVACDICRAPMEIGTEEIIRACPECVRVLQEYMKQIEKERKEGV